VEVALRSALINAVAIQLGPHFYEDPRHFEKWYDHPKLMNKIDRAESLGIAHYRKKYDRPARPPIWTVLEAVTFGTLSQFFSGLTTKHRHAVGRSFSLDEAVLVSWFRALAALRNVCAHHGRLWNAQHQVDKPIAAKLYAAEFTSATSAYTRLVVLSILLNDVDPTARTWRQRLRELFVQYPMINPSAVGCPVGWETHSIWN
jgi:abortive infection bacteriophage resistance protein